MTEFLQRKGSYNPDVLSCLANLSNDEVFTPPAIVNRMLDLLPPDIFRDPGAKFLDPACKTGVFLREIAKRLMAGLTEAIPDENKRREHIFGSPAKCRKREVEGGRRHRGALEGGMSLSRARVKAGGRAHPQGTAFRFALLQGTPRRWRRYGQGLARA